MTWLKDVWTRRKSKYNKNREKYVIDRAKEIYQITEYNHQLWYTYNGALFAPCSIVIRNNDGEFSSTACVALLNTIRDLYVERHKK